MFTDFYRLSWETSPQKIYEMLTGLPPYYTRDRDNLFERIRQGDLSYPSCTSAPSTTFVRAVLFKDPNTRLGGGPTDGEQVKAHAFWSGTDWAAVLQRRLQPPFKPNVGQDGDVKYVDEEFLDTPVANSDDEREREVEHFEGFAYTSSAASSVPSSSWRPSTGAYSSSRSNRANCLKIGKNQ